MCGPPGRGHRGGVFLLGVGRGRSAVSQEALGVVVSPLMQLIRAEAFYFGSYWKWQGPPNMRSYELHRLRMELMLLCALYRADCQRQKA